MTDQTDNSLVARVLATQDMAAYGQLVSRHQSALRAWLRQLTRNHAAADDLAQDTLLHAYGKLHTFSGSGRFQSWLFRIGYTLFLQEQRRGKRRREVMGEVEQVSISVAMPEGETFADLDRLLAGLDDSERRIMVLCYGFGCSHQEISSVCGLPLGTVKSMIHRGKQKLRALFELRGTGT